MPHRVLLNALVGVLCLLGTTTVFDEAEASESETVTVGATVSLTGQYAEFGREQLNGIQMWVDDVNIRGALLGNKVTLIHYDDKSDPKTCAELYERLIVEDRVDLLLGPYSSELTLTSSLVAEKHGLPMVTTGGAASKIWERGLQNVFGVDIPARNYMDPALAFIKEKGLRRVALIYADTEFSREVAEGVRSQAAAHGFEVVFEREYRQSRRDFAGVAQRMRKTNPEAVIGATYLNDSVGFVRAAKAYRLRPKAIFFTVGPALRDFGYALGADANGIMGVVQWMPSANLAKARDFTHRYAEKHGYAALVHAALGYGAGQVLEAAVRLAGSVERNKVRKQLRELKFRSILGRYGVDETGRQLDKPMFIMQWQDGHRRLIWPELIAESPIMYPLNP